MYTNEAVCEQPWRELFERLIDDWNAHGPAEPDGAESSLASAVYTDEVRYEAELAGLFRRLPLCLGHADQLEATGSVLARELVGVPVLLTRDRAGVIRVFLNACRHRGVKLLDEDGVVCRRAGLTCRYHGWTYGLDGHLKGLPRKDAFPTLDMTTHGLRELPSAVRHGLIWVRLDPASAEPADVATYLGSLDADLAALGVQGHRLFRQNTVLCQANWKLIVDAFIEFYHIKRLHAATIGPFFADSKAVADYAGPHQRLLVARESFADVLQLRPEQWSPQKHGTLVHFVFPNSLLVYHPDYISHMGIFPVAIDRTQFVHTVLTPEVPQTEKAKAHWDASFDLIDGKVFNDEDLFICEQIQLGLPATAGKTFPLGQFEQNIVRFHETIDRALRDSAG